MKVQAVGRSVLLVSMLALVSSLGCKKQAAPEAPTPAASASAVPVALTRPVGEKVDVQWNGSWWKGSILAVQDGKYRVHYTGWGDNWDENVTPDRVRDQTPDSKAGSSPEPSAAPPAVAAPLAKPAAKPSAGSTSPVAAAPDYAVGSRVDVNWKGTWYQGKILSKSGTSYRIHYLGWASSWDENVTASRLRPFSGSASKGTGPE